MRMYLLRILPAAGAVIVATAIGTTARAAPPVHEVTVVAKKFAFEPSEIQVVTGERVRLVVRSADSVHALAIRELKIDVQVPRGGDPVVAEFIAPPPGRYEIVCSEFCGRGHAQMKAALVSIAPTTTNR
jgi:heme/copper-type cytochrome/quinol oxidase subunit 2